VITETETVYICEVCRARFDTEIEAIACESQVTPEPHPVGLITAGKRGDFYDEKLAFAIAVCTIRHHRRCIGLWACRDNGNGDSLGDDMCGGGGAGETIEEFKQSWLKRPPIKRLVAYLLSQGIEPLVMVKGKIVPLKSVAGEQFFAEL
jgi:hypothetical protein